MLQATNQQHNLALDGGGSGALAQRVHKTPKTRPTINMHVLAKSIFSSFIVVKLLLTVKAFRDIYLASNY